MSETTVRATTSQLTGANHWDHILARLAWHRGEHRVDPGLYALGQPTPDSPVLVTANYTLSFDAVRQALAGRDVYILVLDTKGVNVWCAAGKGTFGTDELVRRIAATGLPDVVRHRHLILPQLGATGVSAQEVERRAGFAVQYGPVRADDLPEYLRLGRATAEMRRVRFTLADRATLVPVDVVNTLLPLVVVAAIVYLLAGSTAALATVVAVCVGTVLFPLLLPWLPTADLSTKGWILGLLAMLPFVRIASTAGPQSWQKGAAALGYLLVFPAVTAFVALNFTGSTTFTSRTGVRKEIYAYVRCMAVACVAGILMMVPAVLSRWLGGAP